MIVSCVLLLFLKWRSQLKGGFFIILASCHLIRSFGGYAWYRGFLSVLNSGYLVCYTCSRFLLPCSEAMLVLFWELIC